MADRVFTRTDRAKGTYTSGSIAWPKGAKSYLVSALINQTDRADTTLSGRFAVDVSFDASGLTWEPVASVTWKGGGLDRNGLPAPAPSFTYNPDVDEKGELVRTPTFIRAVLDLPARFAVGIDLG